VTGGDNNVGVGYAAGKSITGSSNVTIGHQAGNDWSTGSGNSAGVAITSGSDNVIIGKDADASIAAASNQIVIGANATGQGDTYAVIGDANITRLYAAQDAGATLYAAGLNLGGTAVTSTAAEINIIDGGTSASATTIVDADRVVLNDNGTMKQVAVTDIKTYISSNTYPFVLAELDAAQETTATQTVIGLNTTALVSMGSIFTINASDYIQTSEAGYYEVSANTTWFKDTNASRYLIFQIQKSSDGSSWSDVDGGRFIATAPSASPTYAFGGGRAAVQLSANDKIRVTVKEDSNSSGTLYLRSSGINDSYPGDTTIMMKKIG
jgi:hypothetical protein